MTTNAVSTGVELQSTLLQNTYLQAHRYGGSSQPPATAPRLPAPASSPRFALGSPVDRKPAASGAAEPTQVSLNNATELQNVADTRRSFIELQQVLEGNGQPYPVVLELEGESRHPLLRFAAQLYQDARSNATAPFADTVGSTFRATA